MWVKVGSALAVLAGVATFGLATPSGATFAPTPVSKASTSSRGVTATSINVVFPVISLSSLAGRFGLAEDYVNLINKAGGIDGRKINPMIVSYDPTDSAGQQALCKQWTEGSPPVFAVIDAVGSWIGDNELCVTEEGHTPMIAEWTTITDWTELGSPYLWWIGPDEAPVLNALVSWGLSSGRLGHGKKVGIAVSDQASDQSALNQYLLPELKKDGITPLVETIAADPDETATTTSDAQLAAERFKAANVQSVIPLLPENAFFPYLGSETSQNYFPQLLLSDYQSSVELALGLIPTPYEKALNGQEGVTTETLGGIDDARPVSQGGYDTGVRSCWTVWHKAYPQIPSGNKNDFIEEQGPVQAWCSAIRLFAQAATNAGKDLTRRSFVEGMSKVTSFSGGYAPTWSFGPNKMYGPTEYQVVKVHTNSPVSAQCHTPKAPLPPEKTCWVSESGWKPLPKST
jgi:hypothetical protein